MDAHEPSGSADEAERVLASALLGSSTVMRELRRLVVRTAALDVPVLVTGETGTGKELVARWLHALSGRAAGPLSIVCCPALTEETVERELLGIARPGERRVGRLERADGGVLLLDEVAELPRRGQALVLGVLRDGRVLRLGDARPLSVSTRVLSTTQRDLSAEAHAGRFRQDLFQRLAAVVLHVPPLRERRQDLRVLTEHFLAARPGGPRGIGDDALGALSRHAFPGNVRELHRVLTAAAALADGGCVTLRDLPASVRRPSA